MKGRDRDRRIGERGEMYSKVMMMVNMLKVHESRTID
jgi:hypothetical protein